MDKTPKQQTISIIIPVFNEVANAPLLHQEIMAHLKDLDYKFEFVFVDDGSSDGSPDALRQVATENANVKLIEFSRNFGKEAAVSAGLQAASGDAALILDADFQHPPELIHKFINKWEQGGEVIIGIRDYGDDEGVMKRLTSKVFYGLIKPMALTDIIPHSSDFRLLDRQVIDAFNALTERTRMTRGLIDWLGFKRDFVHFKTAERKSGERSYSYRKLINLAMNSFTAYTMLPLRLAGYMGLVIVLLIGPIGLFIYGETYLFEDPFGWNVSNIVLLALLMLFLIGIVLACLGLVALYIAHIHTEVINRPLYIVRKQRDLRIKQAKPETIDPEFKL